MCNFEHIHYIIYFQHIFLITLPTRREIEWVSEREKTQQQWKNDCVFFACAFERTMAISNRWPNERTHTLSRCQYNQPTNWVSPYLIISQIYYNGRAKNLKSSWNKWPTPKLQLGKKLRHFVKYSCICVHGQWSASTVCCGWLVFFFRLWNGKKTCAKWFCSLNFENEPKAWWINCGIRKHSVSIVCVCE